MKEDHITYLLVDNININFPGFTKIIGNFLKYIPNSKIIHELDNFKTNEIIIPIGIVSAQKLMSKKHETELAFIIDSPTLAMIGALKFYFSQGEFFSKRLLLYFLKLLKYSFIELKVIRKYKKIIVVSEHDKKYLVGRYKTNNIEVVSNGVEPPCTENIKKKKFNYSIGVLSFWGVGGIDDIDWFVKRYLPRLRKKYPQLNFITAGKGANESAINYFEKNNITYLGEVTELNDFFKQIDIMISTKRQECGILNRVLDAFAYKKIVLGYKPNMLAFSELKNGYYTFSSYNEFIQQFEYIRLNQTEINKITENAYNYVRQHHSWKLNYEKLQKLIEKTFLNR